MRRSVLTIALALVALAAPAASAASAFADGEIEVLVRTKAGPYVVGFGSGAAGEGGRESARLSVAEPGASGLGRGRYNFYDFEPGMVTRSGIDVSFGRFGGFRAEFRPSRTEAEGKGCDREIVEHGWFVGEFRFHGEDGFLDVERRRLRGEMTLAPKADCEESRGDREMVRKPAEESESAQLNARLPRERGFSALNLIAEDHPGKRQAAPFFIGYEVEKLEEITIVRAVQVLGRASMFRFDHRRGTATVRPPAPFAGFARFVRRADGDNVWKGNLSFVPLGADRVPLAGPGFEASLKDEEIGFG